MSPPPQSLSETGWRFAVRRLIRCNAALARHPVLFILIMLPLYGVAFADYSEFIAAVKTPFALALPADRQFLYSSPLHFWLGAVLARLSSPAFAFLATMLAGLGLVLLAVRHQARHLPEDARATFQLALLASPLLAVFLRWFGKSDPFLVAFYLMFRSSGRARIRLPAAILLVLAHRELGLIILAFDWFLRRQGWRAPLAGAALANATLWMYQHWLLPAAPASRFDYMLHHGALILAGNLANPGLHLLLALGWFWVLIALRLRHAAYRRGLVCIALAAALGFTTTDYTRTVTLALLPVIVDTALWTAQNRAGRRLLTAFPFPLLFLVQAQIVDMNRAIDSPLLERWSFFATRAGDAPTAALSPISPAAR